MTIDRFIDIVMQDLSIGSLLPVSLTEDNIKYLIDYSAEWFYEYYENAVNLEYFVIRKEVFETDIFKKTRSIKLPDEIVSVFNVREVRRGSNILLAGDPEITLQKMIATELHFRPEISDSLVMYIAYMSFYDLSKSVFYQQIGYDWNKNTKELSFLGRNPLYDVILFTYVKIPLENLLDDILFRKYVIGKCKIMLARLLSTFSYKLPGEIQINPDVIRQEGEAEVQKVEEEIQNLNTPYWFAVYH